MNKEQLQKRIYAALEAEFGKTQDCTLSQCGDIIHIDDEEFSWKLELWKWDHEEPKTPKGFSCVELLVVIGILILLASILIPVVSTVCHNQK